MNKKSFTPLEVSSLKRGRPKLLTGFTLLELMLVVVIVGIIATFAIPGYLGVKQRAEGRQAARQLKLIQDAEKIQFLEEDTYVACNGIVGPGSCSIRLELELPDDGWNYTVILAGGAGGFVATASKGVGLCAYNINANMAKPNFNPACLYKP